MSSFQSLKEQAERMKEKCVQVPPSNNTARRILYSDIELLVVKIDQRILSLKEKHSDDELESELNQLKELRDDLTAVSSTINLMYVKQSKQIIWRVLSRVDDAIRLASVWLFLSLSALFIALPCIFLSPIDYWLVKQGILPARWQLNIIGKLFICTVIMQLSGIHLERQGTKVNPYDANSDCVLSCFSHSSSLDAFMITSCIPTKSYTMAKSELFLIPFFSWCMLAFGGVPVNRSNRNQAVKALALAARSAKMGDSIVIAPEGTRSKSGQLSAFKKGPFYIWEELKLPIVPIVTFGAFELFPPGRQMTHPGKVYLRLLEPIQPHEANSRDEMSLLLRQRMLEALRNVPNDVASPLTWPQRMQFTMYQALIFYITWRLYSSGPFLYIKRAMGLSTWQFLGYFTLASVILTLILYVYMLYIKLLFVAASPADSSKSPSKGSSPKKALNGQK